MRKHSMMFNGITKDYVVTLRGKRRPPWAPLERKYVTVPGVPGAYNESTEVKPRPLDIPILIESKNLADLQKLKEDLAEWLVTDEPKELILSDEPDRVYYAQIDGDLNVEEIISVGAGMLFFKCPDPYKYGEEKAKPFPAIETVKQDFTGKVSGSTVENPHIFKRTSTNNGQTLFTPSAFTYEDPAYSDLATIGGGLRTSGRTGVGHMEQHLFSFNLIEAIERQYGYIPFATLEEKVTWLKANITKLTANWHGKGSNKMANPNGKADFVGKVKGSLVENPHVARRSSPTYLTTPGTWGGVVELINDAEYADIGNLNASGIVSGGGSLAVGAIGQMAFSFNLIEYIKRKYGFTPTVDWLKANINFLKVVWHGRGSGPSGNKANLTVWNGSSWHASPVTHQLGSISKIEFGGAALVQWIDASGFIHAIAYAEASDGTTASSVNTDFVELDVELKPGADKATLSVYGTAAWYTKSTNLSSSIQKTTMNQDMAASGATSFIQSDGLLHMLAYAEPSNGIAPSTIETDYIELFIEVKTSYSPSYVDVGGTVETPPKFSITLKEPTTYLDIIGDNDYMRIGRPVNIDEFAIPERELILHDTMSTMTGWSNGQNSDIDGGIVSGTMESDGNKFIATSVGTGTAWHGPAKIKSLGQSLTDFHVSIQPILDNDELHKIGRIELYLLDSSKKAVGKLSIKDMSKGRGGNYAELRVGDNVVNNFLISEHGTNWDTWHNFNGLLELTKKGNKWTAYVCKFINGDRNNRTARKYVEWEDTANQFTRPVAYVVVHIAGYGTAVPSQMSIQDLQVYKLNTVTTGQIPYIGYTGDVFEFVHKESAIYRNGDYFMRKDFGSRFFNIKPGVNPIVFQPSDKILSVETRWRDRYK